MRCDRRYKVKYLMLLYENFYKFYFTIYFEDILCFTGY